MNVCNGKRALTTGLVIFFILASSTCSRTAGRTQARLGQEFSLAIGQSAVIDGEDLGIRFIDVIGDSRCPDKVTCIWAGQASMTIQVTQGASIYRMALVEPGLTAGPSQESYQKYRIGYDLLPYPEQGTAISPEQYRLSLTVSK
jgi:hypothetical protein